MSLSSKEAGLGSGIDPVEEGLFTAEHMEMRAALNKLIQKEINPYVQEWEAAQIFPAKEVSFTECLKCQQGYVGFYTLLIG